MQRTSLQNGITQRSVGIKQKHKSKENLPIDQLQHIQLSHQPRLFINISINSIASLSFLKFHSLCNLQILCNPLQYKKRIPLFNKSLKDIKEQMCPHFT